MICFGEPWNTNTQSMEQAPVPVGHQCKWCEEVFVEKDQGLLVPIGQSSLNFNKEEGVFDSLTPLYHPYHRECFLRQIVGSTSHQNGTCSCCGNENDETELTKREDARQSVALFEKNHGQ